MKASTVFGEVLRGAEIAYAYLYIEKTDTTIY